MAPPNKQQRWPYPDSFTLLLVPLLLLLPRRHATFKRVRDESLSRVSEEEPAAPAAEAAAAAGAPALASAARGGAAERCPYLPDWNIAHSGVWALAEAGLIRAMEAKAASDHVAANQTAGSAATAAVAAAAAAVPHRDTATTIEHLTQLLPRPTPVDVPMHEEAERAAAATVAGGGDGAAAGALGDFNSPVTGRSKHATPFATHQVNLEQQQPSPSLAAAAAAAPNAAAASPAPPNSAGAAAAAAVAARQPSVSSSQSFTLGRSAVGGTNANANGGGSPSAGTEAVGSSLRSWLSRARSVGHAHGPGGAAAANGSPAAAWRVPLGLGSALTPFQSLRGSMRRTHTNFQLSEGGGSAAAAAAESPRAGGIAAAGLRHGRAHHSVAFAAGLAAATSTAVAVSSAGGVAVSGFVGAATAATTAAAASMAALSTASAAVQLGGHAIEAGSDMLLNRVQVGAGTLKLARIPCCHHCVSPTYYDVRYQDTHARPPTTQACTCIPYPPPLPHPTTKPNTTTNNQHQLQPPTGQGHEEGLCAGC